MSATISSVAWVSASMADHAALRAAVEGLSQDRAALTALRQRRPQGRLLVPAGEVAHALQPESLLYVYAQESRVHFVSIDGAELVSKAGYSLDEAAEDLAGYSQLVRVHERYLANLTYLRGIGPAATTREGKVLFLGPTLAPVPLSLSRIKQLLSLFKLKTLDHVIPWNDRAQAILDEHLRDFETPIQSFTNEQLRAEFRYASTGLLNERALMANMIWQYHSWLPLPASDPRRTDPVDGNIRTFWYHIKPTLGRVAPLNPGNQYDVMLDIFNKLVGARRVFHYRDFGFVDEGEHERKLAPKEASPHILLVAEKAGHFRKLEKLQQEFGISIIALGGAPSLLTAEYLVDELRDVFDPRETPLRLISLVDYDPAGDIIISAFCNRLQEFGLKGLTLSHVLTPARFKPEELPNVLFPIPLTNQDNRTKAAKWIAKGGGIDGKPLGIECEALIMDFDRLRAIVAELVAEAQQPPPRVLEDFSGGLASWGLPDTFSAELLADDPDSFWHEWAKTVLSNQRDSG